MKKSSRPVLNLLIGLITAFQGGMLLAWDDPLMGEEPVMVSGYPEVSYRTKYKASQFERDVKTGRLKKRTHTALDAIIKLSAYKLTREGYKKEAKKLLKEWEEQITPYFFTRDLGDHAPVSKWLAEKYAILEFTLGIEICHALRLDDIKVINFAIPVVFSCIDDVNADEYLLHFQPFTGVVSFWVSFFGCVGGTWGTGFIYCSPIALGVEYLTENFVAPKLNNWAWNLACKQEDDYAIMAR